MSNNKQIAMAPKATGSTEPRDLRDRFADYINVKDFGAKGDGRNDDTAAFLSAASSGYNVLVPQGSYWLSHPVSGSKFIIGHGVIFPNSGLIYPDDDKTYKKSIVKEIPFKFAEYTQAITALKELTGENIPYLYPQGICFDSDGNFYISYIHSSWSNIANGKIAIVKYDDKFVYQGYIIIPYGLESMLIIDDAATNKRYFYHRISSGNKLAKYDITNSSWTGEVLSGEAVLFDVDANFWYDNSRWYVLGIFPDLAQTKSRTLINVYDDDFNYVSSLSVSRTITGWQTSSDPNYKYVPKMQGFVVHNGLLYVGHGGFTYYPPRSGQQRVADIGCSVISPDGSVLRYGVLDSVKFAARLQSAGYTVTRTEAEALCVHPNGGIYNIYIIQTYSDPKANVGGILIVREFSDDGEDYRDCASGYNPAQLRRFYESLWPRRGKYNPSTNTTTSFISNPITGEEITTLEQMLDFIIETDFPGASFYTSSTVLTNSMSIDMPSGVLVELKNCNNYTVQMCMRGAQYNGVRNYALVHTDNGWTKYENYPTSKFFVLDHMESGDWGRIQAVCTDGSNQRVNVLSYLPYESGGSTIYIGGGSTVLRCATWLHFFVANSTSDEDITSLIGKRVLTIEGDHVRPGVNDETVSLGAGNYRWKEIYLSANSSALSDRREKTSIQDPSESLIEAWGHVPFKVFQFIKAVNKKGLDDARLHIGVVAQDVQDVFAAEGLDASRYGLFCYDSWEEEKEVRDSDGNILNEYRPAGNQYSIRYAEALTLEAAYQRNRADKMQKQIDGMQMQIDGLLESVSLLQQKINELTK